MVGDLVAYRSKPIPTRIVACPVLSSDVNVTCHAGEEIGEQE
jgi:hypothetical protein